MMAVGDLPCRPERLQLDAGPPWAREPEFIVRTLNLSLAEALHNVVIVQHDLRLNLFTLLEIVKSLALKNVEHATSLVPAAEDHGGAHGKIKFLFTKFDSRVLVEVHDLLVQVTRPTQVHMLLKVLENQFKRVVGRDAMRDMCCGDIPRRPAHLTSQGMALSQILMCAPAEMRAEGYTAYEEERAASAGSGPSLLVFSEMQRRGDGSSSSSNATGSVASSPGSVTSSKRHSRSGAQASEDAREGA